MATAATTGEAEATSGDGVIAAARDVAAHATALARLELELAEQKLRQKLGSLGLGAALALGAVLSLPLVLSALVATAVAALALALPVWLALLVAAGVLVGLLAVLVGLAIVLIRRGLPPIPTEALEVWRRDGERRQ